MVTLQWRLKHEGSENFFRQLWHSRRHILIVEIGFIRPLAHAGAGAIAGTWTHRPFQAMTSTVTSHVDMTQCVMGIMVWLIKTGYNEKLSRQLSRRLINIFRFFRRLRWRHV